MVFQRLPILLPIFFQSKSFVELENNVNTELDKVYTWLASNKLTLNISKSKFMIVSKKRVIPDLRICLNKTPLQSCDSYKYLGVHIDKNLDWKCHVEYIASKISKACGALAKLRHCVNTETLVNVYNAIVNSYIRYGIVVWGGASSNTLKPLQTMINKAVHIITFAPYGNLDLSPAYKQLKSKRHDAKIIGCASIVLFTRASHLYLAADCITSAAVHSDLKRCMFVTLTDAI